MIVSGERRKRSRRLYPSSTLTNTTVKFPFLMSLIAGWIRTEMSDYAPVLDFQTGKTLLRA